MIDLWFCSVRRLVRRRGLLRCFGCWRLFEIFLCFWWWIGLGFRYGGLVYYRILLLLGLMEHDSQRHWNICWLGIILGIVRVICIIWSDRGRDILNSRLFNSFTWCSDLILRYLWLLLWFFVCIFIRIYWFWILICRYVF